jgi:hypothetical protein
MEAWTKIKAAAVTFWTPRYMDPKELAITSEIVIYNDVTAQYHYLHDDIFCVEIVNPDFASMQKQMFDFVWGHARSMKKIGEFGEAKVSI